jgi:hypothetical protein
MKGTVMEKRIEKRSRGTQPEVVMPQFTRPVWNEAIMDCKECHYNDQDIDTFPCAKCHVRN